MPYSVMNFYSPANTIDSDSTPSESEPMPSTTTTAAAAALYSKPPVGTAHTSRDARWQLPSQSPPPPPPSNNTWKRNSLPFPDAHVDLAGRGGTIDGMLSNRPPGDRSSVHSQYSSANIHRPSYFDGQLQAKDNGMTGGTRHKPPKNSPVIAELKTNVIVKDEFTLVTDLSYHLAARYSRPDAAIMIKVDHSACLALGGNFDPCYILTITALPSQMSPSANKRNATLIQSFMTDILSVPQHRGVVKFEPIEGCNYAINGSTVLAEPERLDRQQQQQGEENGIPNATRHAVTTPSRKSVPALHRGTSGVDSDTSTSNNDLSTSHGLTLAQKAERERKRRSVPDASFFHSHTQASLFDSAAHPPDDRPSTSHGSSPSAAGAALNPLRMNGISTDDLLGPGRRAPNGRPKTIAGPPVHLRPDSLTPAPAPPPPKAVHRQSSARTVQSTASSAARSAVRKVAQPFKPEQKSLAPAPAPPPPRPAAVVAAAAARSRDSVLDSVSRASSTSKATGVEERPDPKLDARAAEKIRAGGGAAAAADTAAANTARRRSTITATPKMPPDVAAATPPPPPIPETKSLRESHKVWKRKSFLAAFRRSGVAS